MSGRGLNFWGGTNSVKWMIYFVQQTASRFNFIDEFPVNFMFLHKLFLRKLSIKIIFFWEGWEGEGGPDFFWGTKSMKGLNY